MNRRTVDRRTVDRRRDVPSLVSVADLAIVLTVLIAGQWGLTIWNMVPLVMEVIASLTLAFIAFWLVYRFAPGVRPLFKDLSWNIMRPMLRCVFVEREEE